MTRAGEFFVLGFDGTDSARALAPIYHRHGLGGAILFARNIVDPPQVRGLTRALRALAPEPWFHISTDQEGGRFQRLPPPHFGRHPAARDLTVATAFPVAERMGAELAALGINLDLAPVLDTDTNPKNPIINVRAFSDDPAEVALIGGRFATGLARRGVHACAKHFPGHGDTALDSHLTLPVVEHPRARLDAVELRPFRQLIASGAIGVVMPAHIVYTALDPERPATFSPTILGELLRAELGFEGVVLTDDLGMAGALSQGDLPEIAVEAFAAGCDQLLICEHHERHEEVIAALGEAIDRSPALTRRATESRARVRHVFA